MSLVVGLEHKGHVYMGSDSQSTIGSHIRMLPYGKMFKKKGYLIGYTGSVRTAQIIMEIPFPAKIKILPDTIRVVLEEHGLITTVKDDDDVGDFQVMQANLLVGHKGKLYEIGLDFSLLERVDPFHALGDAREYAFGVLHATNGMDPEKRIKLALECGAKYCNSVGGEFYFERI